MEIEGLQELGMVKVADLGEECRRRQLEQVGIAYIGREYWMIVRPAPCEVLEREAQDRPMPAGGE